MRTFAIGAFVGLLLGRAASGQDWPQFRGPDGQGHAAVKSVPLRWSPEAANVRWKVPIEGLGWSSPVVSGGRVWVTTATEGGKSFRAVALDAASGKTLRDVEVFRRDAPLGIHKKNSHASPTPVVEDGRVYVHFGTYGTACLAEEDGKVLWTQQLRYEHVHGPGGSPVLVGDSLFVHCDGASEPFLAALDAATGRVRWKAVRPENAYPKKFAFATPLPVEVGGATQLVSPAAGGVTAYEPKTGRAIWHVKYVGGYSVVPRPVAGHGLVFLSTGFDRPTLLAIRPDGTGDVTATHVAWTLDRGAPLSPSPLLVGDELYVVSDSGIATCLDARTGKVHWQERLGGAFSASPIHAAGRIYFQDEQGATTVIQPGTAFAKLARNEVKGRTFASLAAVEGALFLRTETHLFRIDGE
jgi:outer membrane protein assembly factor BamB